MYFAQSRLIDPRKIARESSNYRGKRSRGGQLLSSTALVRREKVSREVVSLLHKMSNERCTPQCLVRPGEGVEKVGIRYPGASYKHVGGKKKGERGRKNY